MNKQAIVAVQGTDADRTMHYFGPFANGEEATRWAFDNCKGFKWHWDELCPVNLPDDNDTAEGLTL